MLDSITITTTYKDSRVYSRDNVPYIRTVET